MALTTLGPLSEVVLETYNAAAHSTNSITSRVSFAIPYRCRLLEYGATVMGTGLDQSSVKAIGWSVANNTPTSAAITGVTSNGTVASNVTFDSTVVAQGLTLSTTPSSPTFFNKGDALMIECVGSTAATVGTGATIYAIIRRA